MTSADSLSLILRRLDEIERKLDRIMEELSPTGIGYSVGRAIVQGRTEATGLGQRSEQTTFGEWSEHERSAWLAANGSIHHRAYCGAWVTP